MGLIPDLTAGVTVVPLALAVFGVTALALRQLIPLLRARGVLDHPNGRSSHTRVTPRGGGLAPSLVLAIACALGGSLTGEALFIWLALSAAVLTAVFFLDDARSLSISIRLLVQGVSVGVAVWLMLGAWPALLAILAPLPGIGAGLVLSIGWVWFINAYNFMDGIDGMAGVETASLGAGTALVAALAVPSALTQPVVVAGILTASAAGAFLTVNWHPARVFLGDCGSIPLGFLCGALLLALAASGQAAAALILPAYYLVDATVTLARRVARGERFWQAHRTHAYQVAHQAGLTHAQVCYRIIAGNGCLTIAAVVSIAYPLLGLVGGYCVALGVYTWLMRGVPQRPAGDPR